MTSDSTENLQQILTAGETDAGARLDVFIARELSVSRERAKKLLQTATLNGTPAKSSHSLKVGDKVAVNIEQAAPNVQLPTSPQSPASSLNIPIIYEDEHLIIVNKPRGLVVHEGAGEQETTLVDWLRGQGIALSSVGPQERAGIVHRLDKDTSGVLAVCKTDAAHWQLAKDFADRCVRKEYSALVCSVPRKAGRIEAPIERHPKNRKKMAVIASGRHAITEYIVEKSWLRFALLNVNILTGRTHQIRVHLAYINHPVVGDMVYGGYNRALENAPDERVKAAIEALQGQALHAAHLSFTHPVTQEPLSFYAPLPEVFATVVAALDEEL